MADSHHVGVGGNSEDEHEDWNNEESILANEYPDPDYIPNYPWLGERDSLHHYGPMFYEQSMVHEDIDHNSTNNASRKLTASKGLGLPSEDSPNTCTPFRAGRDPNDPSFDPDFELSDDGAASNEYISEEDPDSQSPDLVGPLERLTDASERGRFYGRAPAGMRRSGGCGKGKGRRGQDQRRRGRRGKRGQRKPLEPSVEFKMLHSQATMAFIDNDYEEAEQLALQAILVNPEMYTARFLLSEIHMARGDKDKAITALFHAAHTKPRDTQGWLKLTQLLLERDGEDRPAALRDAIYCYGRIIGIESTNVEARYQRAALNRELGYIGRAAQEYEHLLKQLPHNTTVLRYLAEIYIELNDVDKAVAHYDNSVTYYQGLEPDNVTSFSWSDVNICAELFGYQREHEQAILKLKALSRWLLGRRTDTIWERYNADDREWDSEDHPRRMEVPDFEPGAYKSEAYGDGMPLELRVKLGISRLKAKKSNLEEAINHFEWLEPDDNQPGAKLFDYPDLFREAADALQVNGYYHESLTYYEPLQHVEGYTDASYFADMAICYRAIGMKAEAKDCYQAIVDHDNGNVEAMLHLARLYEELGMPERAAKYVTDVLSLTSRDTNRADKTKPIEEIGAACAEGSSISTSTMLTPCPPRQVTRPRALAKEMLEQAHTENALVLYLRVQDSLEKARDGDAESKALWMATARTLVQDFRSNRAFYPYDKHMKFHGYSKQARLGSLNVKAMREVQPLAEKLRLSSGFRGEDDIEIPNEYLGISFHAWLDIFLEYSLMLAMNDQSSSAYEVLSSAYDANVFFHSRDSMFLIHVCWFTCALIGNDEETLCDIARWFMKEYQFVTDGYRLFSALNRLCDSANSWYNCGPSQKYILRQLKAMDFSLISDARSRSLFQERASYTTKDVNGDPVQAEDMDVALLLLYGHILYAGKSYSYSLNYFLRAYALDSTNPVINLSLALAYLHYAIKRQSGNRHHLIMQGFAFLFAYYDLRQRANVGMEKQEADYNVARAYHALGLTHLAIPYYERCLALNNDIRADSIDSTQEDFAKEAAFSLQGLWAANGEPKEALEVTERWLVL